MKEGASHLLIRVLIVPCGVVESTQKLFAADLMLASAYEFFYKRTYGVIVRNSESMCVATHSDLPRHAQLDGVAVAECP